MKDLKIDSIPFHFEMALPMRWNDMDALGHINNVYYFEYFQIARGEYMPVACPDWDWQKHMFVIAHISCDYFWELTLAHKRPSIHVRTARVSNKSFEMEYLITSVADSGETIIHAKGKSVNVLFDINSKKSMLFPDWLRSSLSDFEKTEF